MKILIIYTAEFPYGKGETFLETEILYLSEKFDKILILSSSTSIDTIRELPKNCNVIKTSTYVSLIEKIYSLWNIFSILFWQELIFVYKTKITKINLKVISTMLVSLHIAKRIKCKSKPIIKENREAILFLYSYWCDDKALAIAMLQKEFNQLKTIARFHGWDVYFENEINYLPFRHFISSNLTKLFSISQYGMEYCLLRWKIADKSKIIVSKLGINGQNMIIPSTKMILVSCSNLIPLKNVDLIIKALSKINDISICWIHFGHGSEHLKLETLAKSILPSNISYEFKGWRSNIEVLNIYKKIKPNLFINASSSEGIPVSIMEAMSFGIPTIATNVGGTNEIVNNENGFLLSSQPNEHEITNAIRAFWGLSETEKSNKQKAAYNMWHTNYNAEINYTQFCETILLL